MRVLLLDNKLTGIGDWKGVIPERENVKIHLGLSNNQISDISPIVHNLGIGNGDGVDLRGNPLDDSAYSSDIPNLRTRGVNVLTGTKSNLVVLKLIGAGQSETVGKTITIGAQVLDQNNDPIKGVSVSFEVIEGNCWLSDEEVITKDDGKALVQLKLVSPGKIKIKAGVGNEETIISLTALVEVVFPDPNLEMVIRSSIRKKEGPITDGDLAGLIELEAANSGIRDLTGLEYCVDLQRLWLEGNNVSDLRPLSGITGLRILSL